MHQKTVGRSMSCAWAALALAACALVVRGAEDERARCAPEVGERCRLVASDNLTDTFLVNDFEHKISYEKDPKDPTTLQDYRMSCAAGALEDAAWPRFPQLQRCRHVELTGCSAANVSAALRALHVTPTRELVLRAVPPAPPLPRTALTGLPETLSYLIIAADGGVLDIEPDALAIDSVRLLELENVRPGRLPPQLNAMSLNGSGITEVPEEMLKLHDLRIIEKNLKAITGSVPNLSALNLIAPALETLSLSDLGTVFMPKGLIGQCPRVHTVELKRFRKRDFDSKMLLHSWRLRRFIATDGELTSIWNSFFNEAQYLEYIDLSNNKIKYLLREVFIKLSQLETLHLENNQLKGVEGVAPLSWLQELHLAGNPLRNLCPSGDSELASMESLRVLNLSRTGAVRVCPDWPRLYALQELALRDNAVRVLPCAAQRVDLRIDLAGNPLAPGCEDERKVQASTSTTSSTPSQVIFCRGIGSHILPFAAIMAQAFLFARVH